MNNDIALTTSVPAHAIHLPTDDSPWPSQQEGSHKSTNLEPVRHTTLIRSTEVSNPQISTQNLEMRS